jgi:hypothetical protein
VFFIFAASASTAVAAQAPGATPLVTVVGSSAFNVRVNADTTRIRIPIVFRAGVRPRAVSAVVSGVSGGEDSDAIVLSAFRPRVVAGLPGRGPAILLDVRLRALGPATYDVQLGVRKSGAVPETQQLAVQVVVPAATLRDSGTLIVDRMVKLLDGDQLEPGHLILKETSRKSRLTRITIGQVEATKSGDEPVAGRFSASGAVEDMPAGGQQQVPFQLDGDFPIGTSSGVVEVDAPELAEPLAIRFEVRSRRDRWLIFPIVFTGLVAGFLTRVLFKRWIDSARTRLAVNDMVARLNAEAERRPDLLFRNAVADAIRDLRTALRSTRDGQEVQDAVTAASNALQDALGSLAKRRQDAVGEQASLENLTANDWQVPPSVGVALKGARADVDSAGEKLALDDVSAAASLQETARERLGEALPRAVGSWADGVESALSALLDSPDPLPEAIRTEVEATATPLREKLPSLRDAEVEASLLEGLEEVQRQAEQVRARVARLRQLAWQTLVRLGAAGPAGELAAARSADEELRALLGDDPNLDAVAAAAQKLLHALTQAVL